MVGRRVIGWTLGGALLFAAALVLFLTNRLRDLSANYQELRLLSTLPHPGTVVPTFRTATLSGDTVTVGEAPDSATRQLIYVFNTTCPYCQSTIPLWHAIADSVARFRRPVSVLAISLDSADQTIQYVQTHQLRYRVLTFPQSKLKRLYRATAVPQTLVLDWLGTVLYAKTGILDKASIDSVYAAIGGPFKKSSANSPLK